METLDNAVQELNAVAGRIADVETVLLEPNADTPYLRKKEDQLRKEKEQLRREKEQFRKEKEQLREKENMILSTEKLYVELKIRQSPGK